MTSWAVEPPLRDPVLVAAFEGWSDAANAASDAVRFLIRQLNATDVGGIDAEDYFDFQAARPNVEITHGVVKRLRWPNTRFAIARVARAERDLVFVLGIEPNLRWPAFCREILGMAADLGCSLVVTLGALLGDAPHTRPVRVTGTADPDLAIRLGLAPSRYQGPTGIVGVLTDASRRMGMATVSLWAPVPHYVATPPSPMATHALLERLSQLTGVPLPLQSLEIAGRGWQQHVTAAIDDDGIRSYVDDLEAQYDRTDPNDMVFDDEPDDDEDDEGIDVEDWFDWDDEDDDWDEIDVDGPPRSMGDAADLPSGEAIAAELEEFLRDVDGPDEGSGT